MKLKRNSPYHVSPQVTEQMLKALGLSACADLLAQRSMLAALFSQVCAYVCVCAFVGAGWRGSRVARAAQHASKVLVLVLQLQVGGCRTSRRRRVLIKALFIVVVCQCAPAAEQFRAHIYTLKASIELQRSLDFFVTAASGHPGAST